MPALRSNCVAGCFYKQSCPREATQLKTSPSNGGGGGGGGWSAAVAFCGKVSHWFIIQ